MLRQLTISPARALSCGESSWTGKAHAICSDSCGFLRVPRGFACPLLAELSATNDSSSAIEPSQLDLLIAALGGRRAQSGHPRTLAHQNPVSRFLAPESGQWCRSGIRCMAVLQFSILLTLDLHASVTTVGTADTVTDLDTPQRSQPSHDRAPG